MAAFIARAVAKAVEIAGRIGQCLKKLFTAMDKLGGLAKSSADALRKRADDLAASSRSRSDSGLDGRIGMKEEHMATEARTKAANREAFGDRLQGQGLDARNQRVDDFTDSANTRAESMRATADRWDTEGGPLANTRLGRVVEHTDNHLNKSALDGGNWVRALSGDLGQHAPTPKDLGNVKLWFGDGVAAGKEYAKESNKAFGQEEGNPEKGTPTEKPPEFKTREVRGERDQ